MATRKESALKRRLAIAFGAPLLPDEKPTTPPVKARALAAAFGYLYPEEVTLLSVLAENVKPNGVYVNIGAGSGTSSLCVVETNPEVKPYTIDISPGGPLGGMENEINAFRNADLLNKLPTQLLGDSKVVGKNWNLGLIDLLFIDGDHSYEGCMGDIESWRPHMKPGGIVAIHDYEKSVWPQVKKAVDEAAAEYGWKQIDYKGTMIVFEV